jgi:hypothetical protein
MAGSSPAKARSSQTNSRDVVAEIGRESAKSIAVLHIARYHPHPEQNHLTDGVSQGPFPTPLQ